MIMTAFWIALSIGIVVAATYLALVFDAFGRSRREFAAGTPAQADGDDRPEVYERQGRNFSWMAGGGVIVSTTLLVLVSVAGWTWYILPFLGIGSAVAVILAFLIDRRGAAREGAR
ncbi:MAG TPA: hypothetical protein VF070_06345 [Streptosporangiaceae bacterium]